MIFSYLKWPNSAFKLSTMVEKILNFTYLNWPKIAFKLSTMVGENFEFYLS